MPRSNRSLAAPAILGLIVTSAGLGAWATVSGQGEPDSYPKYYEASQRPLLSSSDTRSAQGVQRAKEKEACRDARSREDSELCAAWRSAKGSQDAAEWAFAQLVLSGIGIFGLAVTLWFNLEAWREARSSQRDTVKALKAAKRQADAATRQANLAEESQRAWIAIAVTDCGILQKPDGVFNIFCTVLFNNIGSTIAYNCMTNVQLLLPPTDFMPETVNSTFDKWRRGSFSNPISILPRDKKPVDMTNVGSNSAMSWHEGSEMAWCVVVAQARYKTANGVERWTEQSFTLGHTADHPALRDGFLIRERFESEEMPKVQKFRSGLCT